MNGAMEEAWAVPLALGRRTDRRRDLGFRGVDAAARVQTVRGLRPAGALRAGDVLSDAAGGTVAVLAVMAVPAAETHAIEIRGPLPGLPAPAAPLRLAPRQELRLAGALAARLFGCPLVRVAAEDFLGLPGVCRVAAPAAWLHVVTTTPGALAVEGLALSAFAAEDAPAPEDVARMAAALPALRYEGGRAAWRAAPPLLEAREARALHAADSTFRERAGIVPATSASFEVPPPCIAPGTSGSPAFSPASSPLPLRSTTS